MYSQDFNDYLPGPTWAGGMNIYTHYPVGTANPTGPNRYFGSLAAYITSYLGIPAPSTIVQTSQVMICPAHWQQLPKTLTAADYIPPVRSQSRIISISFSAQMRLTIPALRLALRGSITRLADPHCRAVKLLRRSSADLSAPMSKIGNIPGGAAHWAVTDDDKEINGGGTYAAWLPARAVHGRASDKPVRNYLYFDWHVEVGKKNWRGNP